MNLSNSWKKSKVGILPGKNKLIVEMLLTLGRVLVKGQIVSKGNFVIFNSSKKWTKIFDLTTIVTQVKFFSFVFFRRNEDTKKDISKLTDLKMDGWFTPVF